MMEHKITFEIKEHIGVICNQESGWTRELNIVSWNDQSPKFDIRDWNDKHDRMGKGITLKDEEMARVVEMYLDHSKNES